MKMDDMIPAFIAKIKPDLTRRADSAEFMDDPNGDIRMLWHTLRHFELINRFLTRSRPLFTEMLKACMANSTLQKLTIADIGGGGGDFCRWLSGFCSDRRISSKILCIDSDKRVTEYAKRACRGYRDIEVLHLDAWEIDSISKPIDFIITNNFLHHVPDDRIPGLLKKFHSIARRGFCINDLHRRRGAYVCFGLLAWIFFRSGFTLYDGLISIRKGFTPDEMDQYIRLADLTGKISIRTVFPYRIVLSAKK